MDVGNKLYRDKAIERLSTPERLDILLQATTAKAWLSLAGAGLVVSAVLVWGVFGRVSDTVAGSGIILRQGGVYGIQAPSSGMVVRTLVSEGDEVEAKQVVAQIAQPDLEEDLREARSRLTSLEEIRDRAAGLVDEGTRLQVEAISQQRRQLAARLSSARENVAYLEVRARQDEEALDRGLITPGEYHETLQRLQQARDVVDGAVAEASELAARIPSVQNQALQALLSFDDRIQDVQERIQSIDEQLQVRGLAESPYGGRVVELLVDEGEAVAVGTQLMLVELTDRPIEAMVFVSEAGKRVLPGMTVRISPAGLRPEEFGYMLGSVKSVSDLPATPALMNRYLRNPALVQSLGVEGNSYMVAVELAVDPTTPSGFRWTSRKGPPLVLGSGTLLDAQVSVREYRPISLVFPTLRRWMER